MACKGMWRASCSSVLNCYMPHYPFPSKLLTDSFSISTNQFSTNINYKLFFAVTPYKHRSSRYACMLSLIIASSHVHAQTKPAENMMAK